MSTKGSKARISYNPKLQENVVFPTEALDKYQTISHLSSNEMSKMTNFLRVHGGRKCIAPGFKKHSSETGKILDSLYKIEKMFFDIEGRSNDKCERVVVYANTEELLKEVLRRRDQTGSVKIKIMADGGGGFFKVCMTILPDDYIDKNPDSDNESAEKRTRYSEGGSLSKLTRLTGVNKLIMLCIVPEIKETYENVAQIFNLIQINDIPFKFSSDFKILLIVNGMQTACSTYPSPYCFVTLNSLRENNENGTY